MDIKKVDKQLEKNQLSHKTDLKWIDCSKQPLINKAFNKGLSRIPSDVFISESVSLLSKHTSGFALHFITNSTQIEIKAIVANKSYMAHMSAIGQIGFDLYMKKGNRFVFVGTTKVDRLEYQVVLLDGLAGSTQEYYLYFPLYIAVKRVCLGIDKNALYQAPTDKREKIIAYGTSITQGGCATRPGMSYTNILSRIVDYQVCNFGFSGSAHLEPAMAEVINQTKSRIVILEVEANNTTDALKEKLLPFINALTAKHIILISGFSHAHTLVFKSKEEEKAINKAIHKSIPNVIFIDGEKVFENLQHEETVDTTHLTDLGFFHLALYLKEVVKGLK